ncbi:glycosyltransferase [Kitasatospora phosalacinea]|uniref:glycosyltransferase n=1 Tax=Kitasatospora phosalacinea TaxID=2065 RepID=UPI00364AF2F8
MQWSPWLEALRGLALLPVLADRAAALGLGPVAFAPLLTLSGLLAGRRAPVARPSGDAAVRLWASRAVRLGPALALAAVAALATGGGGGELVAVAAPWWGVLVVPAVVRTSVGRCRDAALWGCVVFGCGAAVAAGPGSAGAAIAPVAFGALYATTVRGRGSSALRWGLPGAVLLVALAAAADGRTALALGGGWVALTAATLSASSGGDGRAGVLRPLRVAGRAACGAVLLLPPSTVLLGRLSAWQGRELGFAAAAAAVTAGLLWWHCVDVHLLPAVRQRRWAGWRPVIGRPSVPRATGTAHPAPDARAARPTALLPPELSAATFLTHRQFTFLAVLLGLLAAAVPVHVLTGALPSAGWWLVAFLALNAVGNVAGLATTTRLVLIGLRARRPSPGVPTPAVPTLAVPGPADPASTVPSAADPSTAALPSFTVLVPLYQEAEVVGELVDHLAALEYPPALLEILLVVEEDDEQTRAALESLRLPPTARQLLIRPGLPRTKPKACNLGLAQATGELCVVFDAEDRPEPRQLLLAAAEFARQPEQVVCLQAQLQYWNPGTNWLTEFFATEYATRFGLLLPAQYRLDWPILLGGTSNHFRTAALRELGGWDAHNVTEDADLGIRIARRGLRVAALDALTEEEANSRTGNWIRQRSRWIKGHLQTWLVHHRHPRTILRELGPRRFAALQLVLTVPLWCQLTNPPAVLLAALGLLAPETTGFGEVLPAQVRPLLLAVLVLGNLLAILQHAAGCTRRGLHRILPTVLTAPAYWVLIALAGYRALFQLLRPSRRFHWEATRHGLAVPDPSTPLERQPA